jgi:hypothetical protein
MVAYLAQNNGSWESWPEAVRTHIFQTLRVSAAMTMQRNHCLQLILDEFAAKQIPCLLVKGEALARTHYPDTHLRWRVDSDVFIRMSDIEAVHSILTEAGWRIPGPVYSSHQFQAIRHESSEFPLKIDVHWRISNHAGFARSLSFDEAWRESRLLSGLTHARGLGDAHALLLACLHYESTRSSEQNLRMIWLYDMHLLCESMSAGNWDTFQNLVVERKLVKVVLRPLEEAQKLFPAKGFTEKLEVLKNKCEVDSPQQRFEQSNLALLLDDFRYLPTFSSKLNLLKELLLPDAQELLRRNNKNSRLWLPWLYSKHAITGTFHRLSLR